MPALMHQRWFSGLFHLGFYIGTRTRRPNFSVSRGRV